MTRPEFPPARHRRLDGGGGRSVLVWHSDGGSQPLLTVSAEERPASAAALDDYPGQYPLQPDLVLSVGNDNGKQLAAGVDSNVFWQVHRAVVVRVSAVHSVRRDELGRWQLRLRGRSETLPVSAGFAQRFRAM